MLDKPVTKCGNLRSVRLCCATVGSRFCWRSQLRSAADGSWFSPDGAARSTQCAGTRAVGIGERSDGLTCAGNARIIWVYRPLRPARQSMSAHVITLSTTVFDRRSLSTVVPREGVSVMRYVCPHRGAARRRPVACHRCRGPGARPRRDQRRACSRASTRPIYTPYIDTGDHVVVVNAAKVKLTGRKEEQKLYRYHSGYEGGLREERAEDRARGSSRPAWSRKRCAACCRRRRWAMRCTAS